MLPSLSILFEDNHVLVVDKQACMLSQGDLSGDLDILTLTKAVIKDRDGKPGEVYLGLVHRLDRPVSGVMAIAKTSKAASRLSEQFRTRETKKTYLAVVEGIVSPKSATLKHRLEKDRDQRVTRVVERSERGKDAELAYRLLDTRSDRCLLEIDLITGLSHQIRAQLAAIGHPVVGDRKYGSKLAYRQGRIALHAARLTFNHPTKKEQVTVTASLPELWPF